MKNNFLIITKQKLIIGSIIIFFVFSLLTSGITQHNNHSQLKKTIVIDAGHGGIDSGTSSKGVAEKNINLKIAKHLTKYLERGSIKTIMTRTDDSLYQNSRKKDIIHRTKLANKKKADLFVSIHVNSFPGTNCFGGQTFYPPNSPVSKKLAKYIQEELFNIQPENYRQIKPAPFYVLKKTKMPAVLIEVGFLSNPEDHRRLTNEEDRKEIARAIKKGIINYLKEDLHLPPTKKPTTESTNESSSTEITTNNKFQLYFTKVTDNKESLVPVSKVIPVTKIFTTQPNCSLIEKITLKALETLISGPQPNTDFQPVIPKETKLLGVEVKNKIAYVNFSEELITNHFGGSTKELLTINSIVKTLTQFSQIEKVQILINGKKGKSISGHLLLNHPITKKDLPD